MVCPLLTRRQCLMKYMYTVSTSVSAFRASVTLTHMHCCIRSCHGSHARFMLYTHALLYTEQSWLACNIHALHTCIVVYGAVMARMQHSCSTHMHCCIRSSYGSHATFIHSTHALLNTELSWLACNIPALHLLHRLSSLNNFISY